MANHKPIFAVGAALLRQLQTDDRPNVPDADPLASAQSRRAVVKAGAGE
jgi:hypothetical protein